TGVDGQSNAACLFYGTTAIDHDEWFTWTSPVTGSATLQGCGQVTGGDGAYDTKVAVYSGTACPPGAAIGCNDDSCGLTSQVIFPVTAGASYTFQIGDYPGEGGYSGTFTVTATAGGLIPNDDCGSATVIGALPYSDSGTTVGALPES